MENPREIARLLSAILLVFVAVMLISSIVLGDWHILFRGFAVIAGIAVLCVFNSLVNVAVFGPLMWLAGRILSRKSKPSGSGDIP